jgi:hypothetical protein
MRVSISIASFMDAIFFWQQATADAHDDLLSLCFIGNKSTKKLHLFL